MIGLLRCVPRRSILLKMSLFVVGGVWLTVAFLLSVEQSAAFMQPDEPPVSFRLAGLAAMVAARVGKIPELREADAQVSAPETEVGDDEDFPRDSELTAPGVTPGEDVYGELGKPFDLGNVSADIQRLVEEGFHDH